MAGALSAGAFLVGSAAPRARSAPPVPDCRMPNVIVSLGPYVGEATEQHTLALRLLNRGK